MYRRDLIIGLLLSALIHLTTLVGLIVVTYRPMGTLGGGGTGGTIMVTFVGGDEGGTGGKITDEKSESNALMRTAKKRDATQSGRHHVIKRTDRGISIHDTRQQTPSDEAMTTPPEERAMPDTADASEAAVGHQQGGPLREGGDGTGGIGGDGHGWGSAGSGGGAGGGHGGGIGPGSGRGDPRLSAIWVKINRSKYYPWKARRQGWQGMPRVRFSIDASGEIASVALASSCGIPELDEAAIETVRRSAPLPYYPRPITITIRYSLDNN